jgi:hypothetical protein
MWIKEVAPVISDIIVAIEGLKYKDETCSVVDINCHCVDSREDKPIFLPISASCEEPYFVMGKSFWEETFGKRQTNRIVKLCNQEIEKYLKENM